MRISIIVCCCLWLFACTANKNTEEPDTKETTTEPKIKIEGADEGTAPEAGVFLVDDDKDRFPYLQPLNDSTIKMAAYTVRLEATHNFPLRPLVPERTPWFKGVNPNESQGIFLSYVLAGRRLMLSEPNIRIDYINKSVPNYSSVDSAFYGVEAFFMPHPSSQVIKPRTTYTTDQGKDFSVMEILAVRDTIYSPKYQAFAYMDYNDDYLLSIHLTALDMYEFKDALAPYYRLLNGIKVVDR